MRIEDGIIRQLIYMDYQKLDIKISAIDMFYRSNHMGTEIVLILRAISGNEVSPDEYRRIIDNIKKRFYESGFLDIHVLGLILTAVPERARRFHYDEEDHFLVDLWNRRLIIYEDQSPYFTELAHFIENIIHNEEYSSGLDDKGYAQSLNSHDHKIQWVTLLNTLFIAVNIIIYLLSHHTAVFGESEYALQNGALSWYMIKEE